MEGATAQTSKTRISTTWNSASQRLVRMRPGVCGTTYPRTRKCNYPGVEFPLFCTESVFLPCGAAFPTPTPTPTPGPSPEPTCDITKRPNNQNCYCLPLPDGSVDWQCACQEGLAANRILNPQTGCPSNMTITAWNAVCA